MHALIRTASALLLLPPLLAAAPTPSERHSFRLHAEVDYRCYAGTGPTKASDSRTKAVCDNKTVHQTLFDETVAMTIVNEPTPDASRDLAGSWSKAVSFKGRQFEIAISLFKTVPAQAAPPYRLRFLAHDDEPGSRSSETVLEAAAVKQFNRVTIYQQSKGQPEEITFTATISPAP